MTTAPQTPSHTRPPYVPTTTEACRGSDRTDIPVHASLTFHAAVVRPLMQVDVSGRAGRRVKVKYCRYNTRGREQKHGEGMVARGHQSPRVSPVPYVRTIMAS
jgi:hypothetical protein